MSEGSAEGGGVDPGSGWRRLAESSPQEKIVQTLGSKKIERRGAAKAHDMWRTILVRKKKFANGR